MHLNKSGVNIVPFSKQSYSTKALKYLSHAKAENTIKAYKADWTDYIYWCKSMNVEPLPTAPHVLVEYISYLADYVKANTISRKLTAISEAHKAAGLPSPTLSEDVRLTLQGIRKSKGTFQKGKEPIEWQMLKKVPLAFDTSLLGLRSRAILLFGFAGAFRRSELVALDCEDLSYHKEGIKVFLGHAKNDPDGAGQFKGINRNLDIPQICPVRALEAWLEAANIKAGPLFRPLKQRSLDTVKSSRLTDQVVAKTVKEFALRIGADPKRFAGHSLRRGFATSAAKAGAAERHIMKQTGHRSEKMVRRYIEESDVFSSNGLSTIIKSEE